MINDHIECANNILNSDYNILKRANNILNSKYEIINNPFFLAVSR